MKWRSLKNSKPEINELVHVRYVELGIRAAVFSHDEWQGKGRLRASGAWSIKVDEGLPPRLAMKNNPIQWKRISKT